MRFRDGGLVRGLIVSRAERRRWRATRNSAATTGGSATIAAFRPLGMARRGGYDWRALAYNGACPIRRNFPARGNAALGFAEAAQAAFDVGERRPPMPASKVSSQRRI